MKEFVELPAFFGIGLWLPEKTENPGQALQKCGFQSVLTLGDHPSILDGTFFRNASYCLDAEGTLTKFANIGNPFIYAPNLLCAPDSYVLYQLLLRAREHDMTYLSSPVDQSLSIDGEMHEGETSFKLGLRGIPSLAEEVIVSRDIELARKTKTKIHFLAISSARSVQLIARAKDEGVAVTAGVKLENLIYTESACEHFNQKYKCFPPLRTQADREVLREGAKNGIIDNIALGFHPEECEDLNFTDSPFTSLPFAEFIPLLVEEFLKKNVFTTEEVANLLSHGPSKILNNKDKIKQIKIDTKNYQISFKE
jgi:dihydroorotase-like cyclic amidohydrolase